jgi:hypothetical protein
MRGVGRSALAQDDARLPQPRTTDRDLVVAHLAQAGARTTVNSRWVLGWFAGFDKLAMTRR